MWLGAAPIIPDHTECGLQTCRSCSGRFAYPDLFSRIKLIYTCVKRTMFIIQNFILLILGCGDHPNRIEEHSSNDHILFGTVNLQNGETYLSCRNLCKDAHPEFQFYHKFINYQSCECKKMTDGVAITLKDHGAYTFGYSTECGTFII